MAGFVKFLKFLRFKLRRKRVSDRVAAVDLAEDSISSANYKQQRCNGMVTKFSWDEIERFIANFSVVIGYGGFSTVYLAQFPDSSSTTAAVKIQCSSERLNQVYRQELEILLHLNHPNIVKLLGHCDDREEGILIFEYAPNGNLQEKLHSSKNMVQLSWKRRMAIAFQLAQAIEYLHDKCSLQIVHGDIKASNILLDDQLNCKLCDFGSAKMGFCSAIIPPPSILGRNRIMMVGSPGYTDPHYLRTGIASKKNDVYSFGVILLELITGIQAFNPSNGERLITRAEPMLRDVEKVVDMVDPRLKLKGDINYIELEEAKAIAAISAMCLCDSPSLRPCISDILTTFTNNISSVSSFLTTEKNKVLL